MKRNSMIFYASFYEALSDLPDKERLEVYDAIFQYGLDLKEPKLNGFSSTVFKLIKPQLDANIRKWENGCKGGIHGNKGGRPPEETPKETPKETPEKPQENGKETGNVNVNANVNENKNENSNQNNNVNDEKKKSKKEQPKHPITIWVNKNCPRVQKLSKPITDSDSEKIAKNYSAHKKLIQQIFLNMENFKDLNKKYTSAYLTFKNWIDRDLKKNPPPHIDTEFTSPYKKPTGEAERLMKFYENQ